MAVTLPADGVPEQAGYPFSIPAVSALVERPLNLHPSVTFVVGENGSGKSTLIEAIAVAAGFNPEGGSTGMRFATRSSHSALNDSIRLVRGSRRPRDGFFLRAESFFNVASVVDGHEFVEPGEEVDEPGDDSAALPIRPLVEAYGGVSLHRRSHGESFLALVNNRFGDNGFYILDEPEAALSVTGQLALLRAIAELVAHGSQFIIATHSPILTGYPHASIYELGDSGFDQIAYQDTDQYQLTQSFLEAPERFLRRLLDDY